jgi:hypothetical protein
MNSNCDRKETENTLMQELIPELDSIDGESKKKKKIDDFE